MKSEFISNKIFDFLAKWISIVYGKQQKSMNPPKNDYPVLALLFWTMWLACTIVGALLVSDFSWERAYAILVPYEVGWALSTLMLVISPYFLRNVIFADLDIKINFHKRHWILKIYILVIFVVTAIMFLNYCYGDEQLLRYGLVHAITLNLITVMGLVPIVINNFYVFFSFWDSAKEDISKIQTEEELYSQAPKYAFKFKTITNYYFIFYGLYWLLILFSLDSAELLLNIFDSPLAALNFDNALAILWTICPILCPIIYYFLATRNFKKFIMSAIIRIQEQTPTNIDLEKIKFVFFDNKSVYYIGGMFSYFLFPILITLVTAILQNLLGI